MIMNFNKQNDNQNTNTLLFSDITTLYTALLNAKMAFTLDEFEEVRSAMLRVKGVLDNANTKSV